MKHKVINFGCFQYVYFVSELGGGPYIKLELNLLPYLLTSVWRSQFGGIGFNFRIYKNRWGIYKNFS